MADIIREAAAVGTLTGTRQEITIITPGWGSSGYYSAEMLAQAAVDRVFPAGTQMHVDHDGEMARYEQPAGSLTRLAAALTEDARWEPDWVDPETNVKGRLVAESKVFPTWRELLTEAAEYIGASISAAASGKKGEAEGRKGFIVEKLLPDPLNRVDYVTVAGRGGRVSAVLESAINRRIDEATAGETSRMITEALRAEYGAEDTWIWLRDHDDDRCWFNVEDPESSHVYEQTYTSTDTTVTLTGERVEVRATTQYVPITTSEAAPAAAGTVTESSPIPAEVKEKAASKENNMADITIKEERLAVLEESHGRVPALEAKVTAAETRADEAERRAAIAESTVRARDFATTIVKAANADLSESVVARIVDAATVTIPLDESLKLDTDALTAAVNTAREAEETYLAKLAKESGLGQVRGINATEQAAESRKISDTDITDVLEGGK